jgi:phosphoglycolate phosphatase-like HAD superfamily hydrolase
MGTPQTYQHVLFDFDGVICDSLPEAMRAFNTLRADFPTLPEVASKDHMVSVYGGRLRSCLSDWLTVVDHQRFFERHSALMAELGDELELFPGISDVLSRLNPGSASIVTSAYGFHVRSVLTRAAVDPDRFYAIVGKETKLTKTEKIQRLSAKLGVPLTDCLYVGDLESDILYCRDVPIDIAAVGYGYHPRWHLEACSPTYLVDSVAELGRLLQALIRD